jgi:hypothetical protein
MSPGLCFAADAAEHRQDGRAQPTPLVEAARLLVRDDHVQAQLRDAQRRELAVDRVHQFGADAGAALVVEDGDGLDLADALGGPPPLVRLADDDRRVADRLAVALGDQ